MNYEIIQGDALATLKTLPANSVQCCVTSPPYFGLRSYLDSDDEDKHLEVGTEETPEAYVAKLVDVFREVRRVLHPTGVIWVNLGDSYNGGGTHHGDKNAGISQSSKRQQFESTTKVPGLKQKDLIGIPWMVAFALRADGWYLRSEIIWAKKAPMPESVQDRPTKSHEQLFLLSKSPKYFYDAEAIREPLQDSTIKKNGLDENGKSRYPSNRTVTPADYGVNGFTGNFRVGQGTSMNMAGRNKRSVWTLGPESYSGSHFATMPTKLVEPCILAGTSAHGCCANCGSPWARLVEREVISAPYQELEGKRQREKSNGAQNGGINNVTLKADVRHTTVGWQPTCACNADVVPCTVLDCFSGSGTTGAVALKHNRRYIGLELNPDYIELSHKRIGQAQPLLLLEGA